MKKYGDILKGGDLRSIGKANLVVKEISSQSEFDQLFNALYHTDRKVVMRAADAIEKVTLTNRQFLYKHKPKILAFCKAVIHIELKWHLALLVSRLRLTKSETSSVWHLLTQWAMDEKESKIVRVNALQGMFDLLTANKKLEKDFNLKVSEILRENIPSLNARIRRLANASH